MKSLTTATLLSIFLTHFSPSFAHPASISSVPWPASSGQPGAPPLPVPQPAPPPPQLPVIRLNGTIPPTGIACVTANENNVWTPTEIASNLNGVDRSNKVYIPWGLPADNQLPSAPGVGPNVAPTKYIGPNTSMTPIFPATCDTSTSLYYVNLLRAGQILPQTNDVVVYGLKTGEIDYCGVLTNSDALRDPSGYHQCNAA